MPELPEVETLKNQIADNFLNNRVEQIRVLDERASNEPENLSLLRGKKLTGVNRRGKTLVLEFDGELKALVHLMISGRIYKKKAGEEDPRGCMVKLEFESGDTLCFTYLHLGFIDVVPDEKTAAKLEPYGPEALDISFGKLKKLFAGSQKSIKALLLDQKMIAGIGNIYVDEILYSAKVHPARSSNSLTDKEVKDIYGNMRSILKKGIEHRGTTIESWEDLFGNKGAYQHHLKAVSRAGEKCERCGTEIRKGKVAGRTTYFCPYCQKA